MSEHEFDNYLKLLSGILKLSRHQAAEIAGELRAHLEERMADLMAEGKSREEAIALALEEFGDAAGLATGFVKLHRYNVVDRSFVGVRCRLLRQVLVF